MKKSEIKRRSILEMNNLEARQFFLKEESYCSFELPPYITFKSLLDKIHNYLETKSLKSCCKTNPKPYELSNINHIIFNNKDGKYSWRPITLINPAFYIELVHVMTEESHWQQICERFTKFHTNKRINCLSIPAESLTEEKDKAEQIFYWWREFEQKSIELSLDFEYLIKTDISNCYGSLYTHSIAWAIHGKETAKSNKKSKNYIGNIIDCLIQDMSYGQTNSIPQGSVLMDFIAEIVLGYVDLQLSERLESTSIKHYHLLRYRDDYRIFVNNPETGNLITKALTEILIDLGMMLNTQKTACHSDVIKSSIKPDKLKWMSRSRKNNPLESIEKNLLMIYEHSLEYPNASSLNTALDDFYNKISKIQHTNQSISALIAIITDIAYRNPVTYPRSAAIMSKFLGLCDDLEEKRDLLKRIQHKFSQLPNTGYMDIWLQRISLRLDVSILNFKEPLCQLVDGKKIKLWDSSWIADKNLKKLIEQSKIVDHKSIENIPEIIPPEEFELFKKDSPYLD